MTIEEAKDNLTILRLSGRATNDTNKALEIAIKSIATLDEVIKEIEKFNIWYVYKILEEYKKEIE